jgi:PhzF family phenazine biosynthesis protein
MKIMQNKISEYKYYKVNSFAEGKCKGNPAGVCLMIKTQDDSFCKKVAAVINASETAFVCKNDNIFNLRWFTPNGYEVELCGHATLAAAWILWKKKFVAENQEIHFSTKSGILSAKFDGELVTLDFPSDELTEVNNNKYDFASLLGIKPLFLGKTRWDYFIVTESEKDIKTMKPDFEKLKVVQTRGIIVTSRSQSPHYDYVMRFFAPLLGIDEDPVTGSAQCSLGPYWSSVLGKNELTGYQASREGGILRVKVLKDRILLSGKAREAIIPKKTIKLIVES